MGADMIFNVVEAGLVLACDEEEALPLSTNNFWNGLVTTRTITS
jgi:hypothetical protein